MTIWSVFCPAERRCFLGLQERERTATAYAEHPALLRMLEMETLRDLGRNGNARIYIGFDKHAEGNGLPSGTAD